MHDLVVQSDKGNDAVKGVNLAVHGGEIVGNCRRVGQWAARVA